MGSSVIPVPSTAATSDNWVLISSVTPTVSTSTVSFTSISGYKKLMLSIRTPGFSAACLSNVTFNSDTGTNYVYEGLGTSGGTAISTVSSTAMGANIAFASTNDGKLLAHLTIDEANTTGVKNITGFYYGGTATTVIYPTLNAKYFASAAISTVTFTLITETFAASGKVALYGVAA